MFIVKAEAKIVSRTDIPVTTIIQNVWFRPLKVKHENVCSRSKLLRQPEAAWLGFYMKVYFKTGYVNCGIRNINAFQTI